MVLLIWNSVGLFLRKNHLVRCWGWFSLPNWIGAVSCIISIAKTASRKIGALIRSLKFLSLEVDLCFCQCTTRPSMEYCCHAPSCYLELLDKLQRQICRTLGTSFAAACEPLTHCWIVARLSLFCRYYFGRYSSELAQLVHFLILEGGEVYSLFW